MRIVGQNPWDVERYDDKAWTNEWLASQEGLEGAFPRAVLLEKGWKEMVGGMMMPVVVKPVRGRGSSGVSKVDTKEGMMSALEELFMDYEAILVEVSETGSSIQLFADGQERNIWPERRSRSRSCLQGIIP